MKLRDGVLGLVALAVSVAVLASGSTLAQAETRVAASSVPAGAAVPVFDPSAALLQLGNGQSYDGDASVQAGYEIPQVTRVGNVMRGDFGRVFRMPGGGWEMRFPYAIPPEFVRVGRL